MSNPVSNPTWYANIRQMFNAVDVAHMSPHGILLNDYDNVKAHAANIYAQVSAGQMPPGAPWPADQVQTLLNWMSTGFPKGVPDAVAGPAAVAAVTGSAGLRIRKSIVDLSSSEAAALTAAFNGIMQKDPSDPNSYYNLANWHGLQKLYCMHHVPAFLPWHRAYLKVFEDALRTVPGCEDVTLPYWDFSTIMNDPAQFPAILTLPPFANYTVPVPLSGYPNPYTTIRSAPNQIAASFAAYSVMPDLNKAATQTTFETYNGMICSASNDTEISAHDGGHVAIGETMSDQNVAAFDPIFWLYHCNLDRLYWEWQKTMQATNLNGLLSTITCQQSRDIFTISVLESLEPMSQAPYNLTTLNTIDSVNSLNVDYAPPVAAVAAARSAMAVETKGKTSGAEKFFIHTSAVNVRVKGVNRLKIPGSFKVHLLKDDQVIATRAFFQPNEANKCPTCVKNAVVHFDFNLPLDAVSGGKLGLWVEPLDHSQFGDRFPHKLMGNPTINARLLMTNE